jgi:hypothetical protein
MPHWQRHDSWVCSTGNSMTAGCAPLATASSEQYDTAGSAPLSLQTVNKSHFHTACTPGADTYATPNTDTSRSAPNATAGKDTSLKTIYCKTVRMKGVGSYPCNRPWRPIGCETSRILHFLDNWLTDGDVTLSIARRPCSSSGRFLVPVDPRTTVRLAGLAMASVGMEPATVGTCSTELSPAPVQSSTEKCVRMSQG